MSAVKKYDGSTWQSITPKKLKGVPYSGTLPATLTDTKAGYLHRYKIYGNTEQTGTPTPENPIEPSECGERTENLAWTGWAEDFVTRVANRNQVSLETLDERSCVKMWASAGYNQYDTKYIFKADFKESTVYTLVFDYMRPSSLNASSTIQVRYTDGTTDYLPSYDNDDNWHKRTFVTASGKTVKDICCLYTSGYVYIDIDTFMVVEGSTAPTSYIPYGYKLPLTSAGQDVDIYLGESQTTRRIKKLVLDGTEYWNRSSAYAGSFFAYLSSVAPNAKPYSPIVCTHAGNKLGEYQFGNGRIDSNSLSLWLLDSAVSTADFKTYLTAQYNAGTPVTVWYVLNAPETGTLNEPLRKIGDYADTIDSTQTTAQIPTSSGSTTISWAGEGLAPSQFDSVQEWVDIPTYTRINGEWVEDN